MNATIICPGINSLYLFCCCSNILWEIEGKINFIKISVKHTKIRRNSTKVRLKKTSAFFFSEKFNFHAKKHKNVHFLFSIALQILPFFCWRGFFILCHLKFFHLGCKIQTLLNKRYLPFLNFIAKAVV